MKINKRKIAKNFLFFAILLIVVVYFTEYKCAIMRPVTGCSAVCEDRVDIFAYIGDKPIESHICLPWYYKWIGK